MNNIEGFALINKNANTKFAKTPSDFLGKTCRVIEFDKRGGVLVVNDKGTELAMFDKEDIKSSFKCDYMAGVIIPPNKNEVEKAMYVLQAKNRKGGYPPTVMEMVVVASILKGEFYDSFLWAKQ